MIVVWILKLIELSVVVGRTFILTVERLKRGRPAGVIIIIIIIISLICIVPFPSSRTLHNDKNNISNQYIHRWTVDICQVQDMRLQ